jgi:hypothetical protein
LHFYVNNDAMEGYQQMSSAAAIIKACGLDQIKSHVFRHASIAKQIADNVYSLSDAHLKQTQFVLPYPVDQIDLAERIHAYWSIWMLDASGSSMHNFPRMTEDHALDVPLPLPWRAYEQVRSLIL